ncbi:unnamed protein product, partial [Didymodactylos carnosus]
CLLSRAVRSTLLYNFTLIDGNGGNPIPNSALIINDEGFIVNIMDMNLISNNQIEQSYPNVKSFNLKGKFVIPGLIDAHTHASSEW